MRQPRNFEEVWSLDKKAFESAIGRYKTRALPQSGIGTLSEKMLHAVLKDYLAPCRENTEVKVGRYVADILVGDHIVEIQTGNFRALRKKLPAYLENYTVEVVLPLPAAKFVLWTDPDTGEVGKPNKSPKKGSFHDSFYELYWLRDMLTLPGLSFRLMLIDMEEHRVLDGYGKQRKYRATRSVRIPLELQSELLLSRPADYLKLLPEGLGDAFTVQELVKLARISDTAARRGIAVLTAVGVVEKGGKRGRSSLYTINPSSGTK